MKKILSMVIFCTITFTNNVIAEIKIGSSFFCSDPDNRSGDHGVPIKILNKYNENYVILSKGISKSKFIHFGIIDIN